MPTKIEVECAFEIGQLVCHKLTDLVVTPIPFFINEIFVQKCYGGVQVLYACRTSAVDDKGQTGLGSGSINFTEMELMPYPSPEELRIRQEESQRLQEEQEGKAYVERLLRSRARKQAKEAEE